MRTANGLAKLIEECGELQQIAGKRLAYYYTDNHPDGGKALTERLTEEIGDVMAACALVIALHGLEQNAVDASFESKLALFRKWH